MEDIIHKVEDIGNHNYKVTLSVPMELGFIDDVYFITCHLDERDYFRLNYIECIDGKAIFTSEVFLETKALYHYYFIFRANDNNITYGNHFKLSVDFNVPKWAKGKIMYHIFVDRFNRVSVPCEMDYRKVHENWYDDVVVGPDENGRWNTDFYGGSLKGIISKLDYIKSLGVSIIYLSPIFKSQSNHRYDTADYEQIDPYLGSEDDLKELCMLAHEKGMRVIIDSVFNHTGNDSKYFNEYGNYDNLGAFQSVDSPYYDFYRKNGDDFDYWWGEKNLPVCDGFSRSWQDYIYGEDGVVDRLFSYGIDGLRLDVADELTDEFIEGVRGAVDRNKPDGFILGEVWKNPMRMNRTYISSGKAMDTVMNYLLVDALIRYFKYGDVYKIRDVFNQMMFEYPKDTMLSLMNFTSTHDISRIINIFSSDRFKLDGEWAWNLNNENYDVSKDFCLSEEEYLKGMEIYKSYLFSLAFLPGNLSIFYGDEIGMQGEGNLVNRRPFTWNNMDRELLDYFKYIGKVRESEKFLEEADLRILDINDRSMTFERNFDEDSILTIINRSDDDLYVDDLNNNSKVYSLNRSNNVLHSHGGVAIKRKKNKQ